MEEILRAQQELNELERNWHIKLLEIQREEKRRYIYQLFTNLNHLSLSFLRRNSGKYNKPATQYRHSESHLEEDAEPEAISHNALKIRNALKLFTKNEHELDDLIEWLR